MPERRAWKDGVQKQKSELGSSDFLCVNLFFKKAYVASLKSKIT